MVNPLHDTPRALRAADAAKVLNCSVHTIYNMMRAGELPYFTVGIGQKSRNYRIALSTIQQLLGGKWAENGTPNLVIESDKKEEKKITISTGLKTEEPSAAQQLQRIRLMRSSS